MDGKMLAYKSFALRRGFWDGKKSGDMHHHIAEPKYHDSYNMGRKRQRRKKGTDRKLPESKRGIDVGKTLERQSKL